MLGFVCVICGIVYIIYEQYQIHGVNSKSNRAVRNYYDKKIQETKQEILDNMNSTDPTIANRYKYAYVNSLGSLCFDQSKKPNTKDWIEHRDGVL